MAELRAANITSFIFVLNPYLLDCHWCSDPSPPCPYTSLCAQLWFIDALCCVLGVHKNSVTVARRIRNGSRLTMPLFVYMYSRLALSALLSSAH